jgi:hypothetical protein
MYEPGDKVDLFDIGLKEWRGAYVVMPQKAVSDLVKIRNTKTGSLQFVSAGRLRRAKLPPFFVKGLQL